MLVFWKLWETRFGRRTLAAEENGQVPQLGHVEGFEDLALVGCAVAVEGDRGVGLAGVLLREGEAGADGDLGTDDAVAAEEALCEHVHGPALAVGNAFSPSEQLANDGLDGSAAHQGEAVAAVGGDDGVFLGDGVLDARGYGLLACGQMAETSDLLLLVEPVGGHFHTSVGDCQSRTMHKCNAFPVPYSNHVVVHPLELLLCGVESVWRRVKLVGFEALVGELDFERLVIFLD